MNIEYIVKRIFDADTSAPAANNTHLYIDLYLLLDICREKYDIPFEDDVNEYLRREFLTGRITRKEIIEAMWKFEYK